MDQDHHRIARTIAALTGPWLLFGCSQDKEAAAAPPSATAPTRADVPSPPGVKEPSKVAAGTEAEAFERLRRIYDSNEAKNDPQWLTAWATEIRLTLIDGYETLGSEGKRYAPFLVADAATKLRSLGSARAGLDLLRRWWDAHSPTPYELAIGARCAYELKELAQASKYCARGFASDPDPRDRAFLLLTRARLFTTLGRNADAETDLRTAEKIPQIEPIVLFGAMLARADNASNLGRFEHADYLLSADRLRDPRLKAAHEAPANAALLQFQRGIHRIGLGDLQAGEEMLEACLTNQNLAPRAVGYAKMKLVDSAVRSGRHGRAEELALEYLADEDVHREARRTIRALRYLASYRAGVPISESMLDELRTSIGAMFEAWANSPELPGGYGYLQDDNRAFLLASGLFAECERDPVQGPLRALGHFAKAQSYSSLPGATTTKPNEVLTALTEDGHSVLAVLPARFRSAALWLHDGRVEVFELPEQQVLRKLIRELLGAAMDSENAFDNAAESLSAALLPPRLLDAIRSTKKLLVTGGGMLGNLPIEAVRLDGQFVGERMDVIHLPSLAHADPPAEVASARSFDFVGVGCLMPSAASVAEAHPPRRVPLPWIELWEQLGNQPVVDQAATLQALRNVLRTPRGCVQILAHGTRDTQRAFSNGLALFGSEIVRGDAIEDLAAPYVVYLSACMAARGAQRRGDNMLAPSIGGAFLRLGSRAIVAPIVEIELEPHRLFTAASLRALASGQPIGEAVRLGRQALQGRGLAHRRHLLMQVYSLAPRMLQPFAAHGTRRK